MFHPVWHTRRAPGNDIDERHKVATQITEKYNDMHCKEFFDNFFLLVKKCDILKKNRNVVMPFHPRFLAGLRRIFPNNLNFLNFLDDIRVLSEVEDRWKSFLSKKEHTLLCRFDHDELRLLGVMAFMAVMKKEAKMMEVCPLDMQNFLSD